MTGVDLKLIKSAFDAVMGYLDSIETCHACQCSLLIDDTPSHCENCSGDCSLHEGEHCASPHTLHTQAKLLVESAMATIGNAPDSFEKARKIRAGELDDEMPMYSEITGWLQRVPITYLPGLLMYTAQVCVLKDVFKEGGLEKAIARAKLSAAPGSELRSENT